MNLFFLVFHFKIKAKPRNRVASGQRWKRKTFFISGLLPSTLGLHQVCAFQRLWVFTTDRELRPCSLAPYPEGIDIILPDFLQKRLNIFLKNKSCFFQNGIIGS